MTTLEKSVLVPLSADDTFALITEPERLRRWQAVTARVDLRAGGEYRWTIVPGNTARGEYTEVEPGKRVVFSWGWEGREDLPPGASSVTITLEPAEGGTLVRLIHEGLTDDQAASHAQGWEHYLGRLADAAANGDAGADSWAERQDEYTPLAAAEHSLAICQQTLRGIGGDGASLPTPCSEFTVAQLTEHLTGSVTHLGQAAGAEFGDAAGASLENQVAVLAQTALEAWNARGVDGTVKLRRELPATAAVGILALEFLVHAWDYAQATGQSLAVPDALAGHVLGVAHEIVTPDGRTRGAFAEAIETDAGAPALDRLIAFTGRPLITR